MSGLGELVGYSLRLASGYFSDRSGRYWLVTFVGYFLNLLAVPFLALAGNWPVASFLIILERFGRAIRKPPKEAMLSYATKELGRGWGFGLHEAMDQIGAVIGPLFVSAILFFRGSYQISYALLLIPAICALTTLTIAWKRYPRPQDLEKKTQALQVRGFDKQYWLYIAAICCVAAGYVDFSLIAFHFKKQSIIGDAWVPLFFSVAMACAGLSALIIGRLYDKIGLGVLVFVTALSALFAPLVFLGGFYSALIGMLLWGLGLGAHESVMQAVVADITPTHMRGTAYGTTSLWFGVFWFLGSALMGFLYDISLISLIMFSLAAQLLAIPLLFAVKRA